MDLFYQLSPRFFIAFVLSSWLTFGTVCAQFSTRTTIGFRIIVPESSGFKRTYSSGLSAANSVLRRMRSSHSSRNISPSVRKIELRTNEPLEILDMFCSDIFQNNVNSFFHMNVHRKSVFSKDYIHRVAEELGYPLFSWDPDYAGALEKDEKKMVLQVGPTIYHQSKAMLQLLQYFNWTHFTLISTSADSYFDFFDAIENMVREHNEQNNRPGKFRYSLLSSLVFNVIDDEDDEVRLTRMKTFFHENVLDENRIFLLHALPRYTKDLLKAAKAVGLASSKYMWILSARSIDVINPRFYVQREIPYGILGVTYRTDSISEATAIRTAMENVVYTWGKALEDLSKQNPFPDFSCGNDTYTTPWQGGYEFYKALRKVSLPSKFIAYNENGMSKFINLQIVNVQETTRYKGRNNWMKVGEWKPVLTRGRIETQVNIDGIKWPGFSGVPPKGRPERRYFRIATLEEEPYVMYRDPEEATKKCVIPSVKCRLMYNATLHGNDSTYENGTVERCCTGLSIDLLLQLSERMEFDYDLFEVPDRTCGVKNEKTNEWNGLIKILQDGEADMVITSLQITPNRAGAIQFSIPYLETGTAIIVSLRQDQISATAVLEPYDYPAWCLILVFSVHSIGASIFIFEWLSPRGLDQGKTPMREHTFSLFRSFWLIWAMLFGASVSADNPRGVSSRFLGNVWALFALVFLASYTANLAAFMITKETYYDLSGLSDWRLVKPLQHKPPFKFATVPNGSTEENLRHNHREMFQYMKKYNKPSVKEAISALKRGDIQAFIYDSTPLQYQVGIDKACQLMMVGQAYAMTGYGVAFPMDTSDVLRDEVNKIILNLQEDGELDRLRKFWLSGPCHAKQGVNQSSDKLRILNFTSAFILLASGIALGGLLLVFEHVYFRFGRRCLKEYDKCGCCALVSLSMGKSLTFEQSVMEAIDFRKKHRCKDPLCETQLWKVRHELDLALLRIEKLTRELRKSKIRPTQSPLAIENQASGFDDKQKEFEKEKKKSSAKRESDSSKLERGMRRSPSYTQAVTSPSDDNKKETQTPMYRFHDGKYYENVNTGEV